jgi:hypothetical protein
MDKVMEESGLPPYIFYDLRGNHDKFGVPMVGSTLDYFSKYSISSLRNRSNAIQSVTLMVNLYIRNIPQYKTESHYQLSVSYGFLNLKRCMWTSFLSLCSSCS